MDLTPNIDYLQIWQDYDLHLGNPPTSAVTYVPGMTIDALAGVDTIYIDRSYSRMPSDFTLTADATGVVSFSQSSGGLIKLVNFEKVEFLSGNIISLGTASADTITGDTRDDKFLYGLAGKDKIDGKDGNDILQGGADDDLLIGGSGGDTLDGGTGINTASYATAPSTGGLGVTVSLDGSLVKTSDAVGDTFVSIQNLSGSPFADTLRGDAFNNTLDGSAGGDTLTGMNGNDILIGGAGPDKLDGGAGLNTASYITAAKMSTGLGGVTVSLDGSLAKTSDAVGDTFVSIQNLTGSNFNDSLKGNSGANVLTGNAGNDTLNGVAGADKLIGGKGADVLTGGLNNDTFVYTLATDSVGTAGSDKIMDFVKAQGDKIDVSGVDANPGAQFDQAFTTLIASATPFSTAGQFKMTRFAAGAVPGIPGAGWKAEFNTNTSTAAEMTIYIQTKDSFVNNTQTPWFKL